MKLNYYPETDSLYVEFKDGPGVEARELTDGLNVDLDHASTRIDLGKLEIQSLPVHTYMVG